MKQDQLLQVKKRLEKQKQQLMNFINTTENAGLDLSLSESIEELSVCDQHPADVASEVFERGKDFALCKKTRIEVENIDHALEKLQSGTYGRCDICGQAIPRERLQAIPATGLCVQCSQVQHGLEEKGDVPSAQEKAIQRNTARAFGDFSSENMYDGEDTWQDLARWQEHAPNAGAGSYYGGDDAVSEPRGYVESVDAIAYQKDADGLIYKSTRGLDDESAPHDGG